MICQGMIYGARVGLTATATREVQYAESEVPTRVGGSTDLNVGEN